MTTIDQTVRDSLTRAGNGGYFSYAAPVIRDLKGRELTIAEDMLSYAEDLGADVDAVKQRLRELGMEVPADPEPDEPDDDDDELEPAANGEVTLASLAETLAEIQREQVTLGAHVDSLREYARSRGYRG